MRGLPKSGMTTYARGLQEARWVRACPDDVRRALHGRGHHPPAEPLVWANTELTVSAVFLGGHSVVLVASTTTECPPEIHAFLGTDRLAVALDDGGAMVAFHGHVHRGPFEGVTPDGVPVFNVSLPVLEQESFVRPYHVVEL